MVNVYTSLQEQTIFDVALQHYGNIEGVRWLLQDNPTLLGEDGLFGFGVDYRIRQNVYLNKAVVVGYAGYVPVTEGGIDVCGAFLYDENGEFLFDNNGETLLDDSNCANDTATIPALIDETGAYLFDENNETLIENPLTTNQGQLGNFNFQI
jgi:hypothetical protein